MCINLISSIFIHQKNNYIIHLQNSVLHQCSLVHVLIHLVNCFLYFLRQMNVPKGLKWTTRFFGENLVPKKNGKPFLRGFCSIHTITNPGSLFVLQLTLSIYLEHPLSRPFLYLELKSRSLCVNCNLFFALYLELSLSRTNFLVPCEFEIERVNCIKINTYKNQVSDYYSLS